MRHSVRAAGKRLAAGARIALAAFAAAAALHVHARAVDDAPTGLLAPQGVIVGGFAAPAAMKPGRPARGGYVKLIFPSSVAAVHTDLFVADSGQGLLLRIDTMSRSIAKLAALPTLPDVRLKAAPDGTVYVLRPDRRDVVRLTRDGRELGSFGSDFEILRPSDLVVEPTLNRVWVADAAGGVFAFHPSGRMSEPLAGRGDGFASDESGATLLAAGRLGVVGIDPRCRCVIVFDRNGAVAGRFGEGELINPSAIALDDHDRVWVIDRGDRRLKVFDGVRLAFAISAPRLGLVDFSAIAIDAHRAYVADGPGGKIGVFSVLAPAGRTR